MIKFLKSFLILVIFPAILNANGYSDLPLKNWGLVNSKPNSHIDAPDAWTLSKGNSSVVVAIIDTGIDANHLDLKNNLWHDPDNKDVYGWNFVNDTPNPSDDHGHGTHVAGIIGAINDPANGISGVSPRVSIMAVKFYSDSNPGSINLANTIKAVNYAIDYHANIINYSGGGPEFSEEEYLAMKRAEDNGILVVAAAGNDHKDADLSENYYYPSSYHFSNIITVASTDINNKLLPSSNWGNIHVDVTAPGENIYSSLPGNRYGYMTGTSQATAFVTGIAALLLAKDPSLTPIQIKSLILGSVDRFPQLKNKTVSSGRVNAYSALLLLEKNMLANPLKMCKYR